MAKLSDHSFLLSILLVMAVFLPVNYFSFINFDDTVVVERISNNFNNIQWNKLFFRSYSTQYYRPLLEVICYMDYALWGLTVQAWHLTNYIIHILNACLVYQIARIWLASEHDPKPYAAFAMLFFALNPVTCESVAWISGRSDLAGTFFALFAVRGYYLKSGIRYIVTPMAILAGLLCKENALAVIPIIVMLEMIHNFRRKELLGALRQCLIWIGIVSIPLILYAAMRTNGFENYFYHFTESTTAKQLVSSSAAVKKYSFEESFFGSLFYLIPVTGFYFKKLIFPFPLNFAITQINTFWYAVLLVIICGINIVCIFKKIWQLPVFCMLLVFSFSPALMVAFDKVAWTPMAERYLYLSLPLMGIGFALFLKYLNNKNLLSPQIVLGICIVILSLITVSTFHRQFVFKDDKSLWAATLRVNPESSMVLCMYAGASEGEERKAAFQKALSNPAPFKWRAKALLSLSGIEIEEGTYEKALEQIQEAIRIEDTFKNYRTAASMLMRVPASERGSNEQYLKAAVYYYRKAYDKNKNALFIYNAAKLLAHLGEDEEAESLYKVILEKHPKSKYAAYAKIHTEH